MNICSVDGCQRKVRTMDMCASHYAGKWNKENREQYNANWRSFYGRNTIRRRRKSKEQDLRKLYGIGLEDYDAMVDRQGGVCAICGRPERQKSPADDARKDLAVDHNHETGKIRGLLCGSCNRGLGYFGEDAEVLIAAARYLERSND